MWASVIVFGDISRLLALAASQVRATRDGFAMVVDAANLPKLGTTDYRMLGSFDSLAAAQGALARYFRENRL